MGKQEKINQEELRYNYLGFDVAPGKIKEFWDSEDEKKNYVEKIREKLKKSSTIVRDFSMVNAKQINKADRYIISLASVLMIISLILPYYNFSAFEGNVSGNPISYLFHLGYISNFLAWGGIALKLILILSVVMIITSPVIGIMNLVALNTALNKDNYYSRLKKFSKLNLLALIFYILIFTLAVLGQTNPFGSLGVEALGERFTLLSLISMSSFSIWVNIGAHLLGLIPAMEL